MQLEVHHIAAGVTVQLDRFDPIAEQRPAAEIAAALRIEQLRVQPIARQLDDAGFLARRFGAVLSEVHRPVLISRPVLG